MINAYLNTKVEVIRDGNKILDSKANIQEKEIYFGNVDIRVLDVIKVPSIGIEYQIIGIYVQPQGNRVLYKKATYRKVG
jgi:hypothetical protein